MGTEVSAPMHAQETEKNRRDEAVDTSKVTCLGHFPNGDAGKFVEVGRIDLRFANP